MRDRHRTQSIRSSFFIDFIAAASANVGLGPLGIGTVKMRRFSFRPDVSVAFFHIILDDIISDEALSCSNKTQVVIEVEESELPFGLGVKSKIRGVPRKPSSKDKPQPIRNPGDSSDDTSQEARASERSCASGVSIDEEGEDVTVDDPPPPPPDPDPPPLPDSAPEEEPVPWNAKGIKAFSKAPTNRAKCCVQRTN